MRRPRAILLLALAAAAIGGCRDEDGDRARAAVEDLLAALERGDGAAACSGLSEAGVSELLLAALRVEVDAAGLDAADAPRCALVASRLADGAGRRLSRLRNAAVTDTVLEGDRAVVRTAAGAYEAREVEGRWRVARLDPVAAAVTTGLPRRPPVHMTVVHPKLEQPALGASLAGRTDEATIEISGSLDPDGASLRVLHASRARVRSAQAQDGRFRIRLSLQRGSNRLTLRAEAANREPTELSIDVTREAG
ncbi:MAG: hypothetical protein ACLGI5_09305 [Thermoleophilia bacterium]